MIVMPNPTEQKIIPPGLGGFAFNAAIGTAFNKWGGASWPAAIAKGAANTALYSVVGGSAGLTLTLGSAAISGTTALYNAGRTNWSRKKDRFYSPGHTFIGGGYRDTSQALTMRQAAVNALDKSRMNGRLVLGNEASYLHK